MLVNPSRQRRGFTLVELLVVIGIIALLISILLPSLNRARRAANSVKCAANLHSIMLAFQIYGSQNQGWLMGSPWTTGYYQVVNSSTTGNANSPSVIQAPDWMTPCMEIMGVRVTYSPTADAGRSNGQARWDRVSTQLNYAGFHCPDNDVLCPLLSTGTYFPGATGVPVSAPYVSYATSLVPFLVSWVDYGIGGQGIDYTSKANFPSGNGGNVTNQYAFPAPGYTPKLAKIGEGSRKICISDGGRYVNFAASPPAFDMTFNSGGTQGGEYSDYGAWSSYANGRQRTHSPAFTPRVGGTADDRVLWARHGTQVAGQADGAYRFNAGFFDGHVESMSVADGTNPELWAPKGSEFLKTEFASDVEAKFDGNMVFQKGNVNAFVYIIPK